MSDRSPQCLAPLRSRHVVPALRLRRLGSLAQRQLRTSPQHGSREPDLAPPSSEAAPGHAALLSQRTKRYRVACSPPRPAPQRDAAPPFSQASLAGRLEVQGMRLQPSCGAQCVSLVRSECRWQVCSSLSAAPLLSAAEDGHFDVSDVRFGCSRRREWAPEARHCHVVARMGCISSG